VLGRAAIAVVLILVLPAAAAADEVALEWSIGDRFEGPTSIALTAAQRRMSLRVDVDAACPSRPAFSIDGAAATVSPRSGCGFDLSPVPAGTHELAMQAAEEHDEVAATASDYLVVSIGDSVASGEGNPDATPHTWLEPRCHRSLRSGAALAARAVELGDRHSVVTFVPLACSGATIEEGLLNPYDGIEKDASKGPLPPQVDQLLALRRPSTRS
jgi:hypothetical protein